MLVGQALDDLESERLDLATAFQLVVNRAWSEGHQTGLRAGGYPEQPTRAPPAARSDDADRGS
jgi:hypothetical protein